MKCWCWWRSWDHICWQGCSWHDLLSLLSSKPFLLTRYPVTNTNTIEAGYWQTLRPCVHTRLRHALELWFEYAEHLRMDCAVLFQRQAGQQRTRWLVKHQIRRAHPRRSSSAAVPGRNYRRVRAATFGRNCRRVRAKQVRSL